MLDAGAGTGFLPLLLARRGYQATTVDLSAAMLQILTSKARSRGLDIRRTARSCNARAEHAIMRHRAKGKLTVDMWCIVGIYLERVSGCRRRAVSRRVVTWCEEQTHLTLGFRSIAGIRSWPSLRVSARPGGAR